MKESDPAGAVLAGGRSRRMQGQSKAFLPLAGKPMLQHVIDRVAPQVSPLLLVLERHDSDYDAFGLEQVEDPVPGSHGPLGGLLSAMRVVERSHQWLLLVPCDAPFVPTDLGEALHAHAVAQSADVSLIRQGQQWQPTFSVWRTSLLPQLERAVEVRQMGGLQRFLRELQPALLDWPCQEGPDSMINPFFNVNDADALEQARRVLETGETNSC